MKADHMHCMDAERLLSWILHDLQQGSALGIAKPLFFVPRDNDPFRLHRYGKDLETPVGVAAGPHTQLAQNIIAAWLTGARYIELKTVQVLDELNVTKPCIDLRDEGYNCEWSQELKLEQSYGEYLKAWVLLHILHDALGFAGQPGFIFNMSAGYDLKGIQSPTVQRFFDKMTDCQADVAALKAKLAAVYPRAAALDIPGRMSDSLTISCMHGCPPDEVERIALYFIEERRFHTTLKLNPTLLGPENVRGILNDKLGYPTIVPDIAFGHDLVYDDAVQILKNCRSAADKAGVFFSIKLTNTLETTNTHQNLPKNESMVYMSGRSLHPISVHLAARLQKDFEGTLDISFSAGVDTFNLPEVLSCGLAPVTVCSDLLKPGGYGRLSQYMPMLAARMRACSVDSIGGLILSAAKPCEKPLAHSGVCGASGLAAAMVKNLECYAATTVAPGNRYGKKPEGVSVKTRRPLPRFDCAAAPCVAHCPAGQNIPAYLERVAEGDNTGAWQVIMDTNPLPHVQGQVCNHRCQTRCTRVNYDTPLLIREIKRHAAEACGHLRLAPAPKNGKKVAIIGAGPSGLTCAHYLALAGCSVTLFEAKDRVGGMAADAIPAFRLAPAALKRDVDNILALGVDLRSNVKVSDSLFADMQRKHDALYVAVGAQKSLPLSIPGENAAGVLDQLRFLSDVRQGRAVELGQKVLVVGGGNSAMDVARTALRLGADVTLVYRRTCAQMPCDREELEQALEEGVKVLELARPEAVLVENGRMTGLEILPMKLEDVPGQRPRPVPSGEKKRVIAADSLIVSIGQQGEGELAAAPAPLDAVLQQAPAQWQNNILVGGDAARGAATLIEAIGDGRRAALAILQRLAVPAPELDAPHGAGDTRQADAATLQALRIKQARRHYGPGTPMLPAGERINFDTFVQTLSPQAAQAEAARCLQCDIYCGICVTVCPNRANVALDTRPLAYAVQEAVAENGAVRILTLAEGEISQPVQIVNLGDACNECGNCAAFCPTAGAPYKDKPRLHITAASFAVAESGYHLPEAGRMEGKQDGLTQSLRCEKMRYVYEDENMRVELCPKHMRAQEVSLKNGIQRASLTPALEMALMYRLVSDSASYLRTLA